MRILIIEDEPVICLNLQAMLLDLGHRPLAAATLAEADAILQDRQFDCAILDIALPDGDGYELAERLRDAEIPFAFSTGAYLSSEPRFADAPILAKPYGIEDLVAVIDRLEGSANPTSAERPLSPERILPTT